MLIVHLFAIVLAMLFQPTHSRQEGVELTIMSFNLRYATANDGDNSWPHRNELVLNVIKDRDADIVGVQEALGSQLDEITNRFPGYGVIGIGRDDGRTQGEYSAILYRTDRFNIDSSGTFWLSDTPKHIASSSWGNSIPRICTWTRLVDRQSGEAFYIFNTHLDHRSQPSREKSTQLIAHRIAIRDHSDPFILMGDFNAGESNPAITSLTDQSGDAADLKLMNSYRVIHPTTSNTGTFNGFTGETSGEMIDHLFVPIGVTVLDADIDHASEDGRYPSDHFPIWAKILISSTDP